MGAIILINVVIGFFQSLQAEKTINSLRSMGSPTSSVFRDGKTVSTATADLVPGDIVDLNTGDCVPADMRLIEAVNLETDEALLTGESVPVSKIPVLKFDDETGPGDRLNVVYSSTIVTKGRGRGVVFATGMFTEIGLIASALKSKGGSQSPLDEKRGEDGKKSLRDRIWAYYWTISQPIGEFLGLTKGTPLQIKLSQLFLLLFVFAVIFAIIVLGANEFSSRTDVIIYAITTAVGCLPVSLLIVLTLTMAAGTMKMVERHVIVRNLSSLEALGGVTSKSIKPLQKAHM